MAYFLKKSNLKKGTYLQIYESFYDSERRQTAHTYFDCTNFYFEIDREDSFRKKGPSKENRKEPIVGLGLLLELTRSRSA